MRLDELRRYLAEALADRAWLQATTEVIPGGRSNVTYRVTSGAGQVVVRRPPVGVLLATAHDMGREQRVLSALAESCVPVPVVLAACSNPDVLGVPFYVMEYIDGVVVREAFPPGYADSDEQRRTVSSNFIDALVALHITDIHAVGLSELGRPVGFLHRQVDRWTRQWIASNTGEVPEIDALLARLAVAVPESRTACIVHGDFRLDNVLFGPHGDVLAVLDWEMATLGDPLADLGLLLSYWDESGDSDFRVGGTLVPSVTSLQGMYSRNQVVERYACTTDSDLKDLGWYIAFGFLKQAVVGAGIAMRAGEQRDSDEGVRFGAMVPLLAGLGLEQSLREGSPCG